MNNCEKCVNFVKSKDEYNCGKCCATGRPTLPNDICGNFDDSIVEKEEKTNETD